MEMAHTDNAEAGEISHVAYLGLGSNMGDRERNIRQAVRLIGARVGAVVRQSSIIQSEPWGFESENWFANAVVCFRTTLSPYELLYATQQIEREMGRRQKSTNGQYHDRIIDIDILLYDDTTIDTPELTIPHPLMEQRDFVMTPLREIMEQEPKLTSKHTDKRHTLSIE